MIKIREDICVVCGQIIPEGRIICPNCERKQDKKEDASKMLIKLNTFFEILDFVKLCSKCPNDVLVYSGRYSINGKSLMGMYSLDFSKPLTVKFYGDVPYEVRKGMKKFIME